MRISLLSFLVKRGNCLEYSLVGSNVSLFCYADYVYAVAEGGERSFTVDGGAAYEASFSIEYLCGGVSCLHIECAVGYGHLSTAV